MPLARDITKEFTDASSALATGELVKDDFFTLMESVGALEIMDPKMDSGHLQPGESLEPEYDFSAHLTPGQLIGLMDQLLCSEVAWQQGHPLAQTVFTSLYVDRLLWPVPKSLEECSFQPNSANGLVDIVLRAYCCAVIKACDLIHMQVTCEQYYEEEDFAAHLFNRQLLSNVPVSDICVLLGEAEAHIHTLKDIPPLMRDALVHRLQFRGWLLQALSPEMRDERIEAQRNWATCQEKLQLVESSLSLGIQVPTAFSQKVQRKLASSTPPRPIVEVGLDAAFNHMKRMCSDGQETYAVLDCNTGSSIITFSLVFMARTPQPNVYIRCLLQSLVYREGLFLNRMSHKDLIFQDLRELILGESVLINHANDAAEAPQSNPFQIAQMMNTFADATSQSFADLVRCLCMNRSRTRRMLSHTLNDWENLQFEAEDVDARIRTLAGERPLIDYSSEGAKEEVWSFPLSSWVYLYKLRQMEWIVQMGFELQVYMPDELPGMFWYLRYLAETRAQHLTRIHTFAERAFEKTSGDDRGQTAVFQKTFTIIEYTITEASAVASFAEALCYLYKAFVVLKLIAVPPRPYSTETFRRRLRLRPFLAVSLPAIPSESEMGFAMEASLASLSTNDTSDKARALSLLNSADESARTARKRWDTLAKQKPEVSQSVGCEDMWRKKTKDVTRSVVAAGIAIAGAKKAVLKMDTEGSSRMRVEIPEAGYHEWWPVPGLRED